MSRLPTPRCGCRSCGSRRPTPGWPGPPGAPTTPVLNKKRVKNTRRISTFLVLKYSSRFVGRHQRAPTTAPPIDARRFDRRQPGRLIKASGPIRRDRAVKRADAHKSGPPPVIHALRRPLGPGRASKSAKKPANTTAPVFKRRRFYSLISLFLYRQKKRLHFFLADVGHSPKAHLISLGTLETFTGPLAGARSIPLKLASIFNESQR